MGFGNFLKKVTTAPFRATGQLLQGKPLQAFKTGVTGGGTAPFSSKAPFLGGGDRAGGGQLRGFAGGIRDLIERRSQGPMMAGAQAYFNSFSPEDQGSITQSFAGNRNGMNDWFRNAQAAGAVPAPPAAPPPEAGAGIASAVDAARKRMLIQKAMGRERFDG